MSIFKARSAFVLMTAMPPTQGHADLIRFASLLPARRTAVIVNTQPGEPYVRERVYAIEDIAARIGINVHVHNIHRDLPQEPKEAPGFWPMWAKFLTDLGYEEGDYIVASEAYGVRLAEEVKGVFIPYDIDRSLRLTKATLVREDPLERFSDIAPEFQKYLRKTVTIFGAESCGKSTITGDLAIQMNGHAVFEWARPYLETVGAEVTEEKMATIVVGQSALQEMARTLSGKPFIFQDTDLYSTLGYYKIMGIPIPQAFEDIIEFTIDRSDLYLIMRSNIPFEADPLRYGGDVRESTDQFWIDICEEHGLRYKVVQASDRWDRVAEACEYVQELWDEQPTLTYTRRGND